MSVMIVMEHNYPFYCMITGNKTAISGRKNNDSVIMVIHKILEMLIN